MGVTLQSERLNLRELDLSDLDFVAAMLADPDVMRFYPKVYTRDEAEAWVLAQQERYARDGFGFWLAIERETGVPIGQAGVLNSEVDGVSEPALAYMVHRPFWRRGFATEAAAACRDYVFETLDRGRVITLIRPENLPSQGVARKIGMTPEGRTIYGGFEHLVYSIVRTTR